MIRLPKPQKFSCRLASIEKVSSKIYLERFELLEPKEIAFLAGQTVMLTISPGVNRTMSIASPPKDKKTILLVHDVSPDGPYSQWALSAKPGDPMTITGPLGMFVLDRESHRKIVFVATESGISPFHSMILETPIKETTLYWGLRREEDIFWHHEFQGIPFHLILSQPRSGWKGEQGHVQDSVFTFEKNILDCDIYLCGNRNMVTDMRLRLSEVGVPAGQIRSEFFH